MKYKIAELVVEFEPKYNMLKSRAEKYKVDDNEKTVYRYHITKEQVELEKKEDKRNTDETAEYMLIGNAFYKSLLKYNGCLLHSSAVVVDNEAYLFSAPCGTGKSTHTGLWMKYLKDKNPYILNDDKPAIRIMEDGIYAYGTPFSGKYDISENKKVRLKGICFLEQSKINHIRKLEPNEIVHLFFQETFRNLEEDYLLKFFDILDIIIKEIPIYKLYCDMSEEAVQLSYKTMKEETRFEK